MFADPNTGNLTLATSANANDGKGVKFENLAYDAVGLLALGTSSGNETDNNNGTYESYVASNPWWSNGSNTLHELLSLTIPSSDIREDDFYTCLQQTPMDLLVEETKLV